MAIRFPTPEPENLMTQIDYRYDHIITVRRKIPVRVRNSRFNGKINIAIHPRTNQMYVADLNIIGVGITIFSDTGEYLNKFQHKDMKNLWGISIHQDYIYVTDTIQQSLFKFKIEDSFPLVAKVGDVEGVSGQSWGPRAVAVSNFGDVFVIDSRNKQLKIFNSDLCYQRNISDDSLTDPLDLKIWTGEVYVLNSSCTGYTVFFVFSFAGEKLSSIILHSSAIEMNKFGSAFCFDTNGDIIICDTNSHMIRLCTRDGKFICTLGTCGDETGKFIKPRSLALTSNRKLVVSSWNYKFFLQIFY